VPENGMTLYQKTHNSLTAGLSEMTARTDSLDLTKPGVEFTLQKLVAAAQEARDIAKDRREREAKPFEEPLAEIKARWKPLIDGFDVLFKRLKVKASEVLQRQRDIEEKKRREAETRLESARAAERARFEESQHKTNGAKNDIQSRTDTLEELRRARLAVDALPPAGAPIGVKTDSGTLSGREVWKWEVEDLNQVPDAYVQRLVDPVKVDMAVKNGARNIPGIRVYSEVEMASRRTKSRA